MRKRALTILTAGLLLPVLPPAALASEVAADRVPITDPALLGELGFPPDTQGIYALPGALERLLDPSAAEAEPEPRYGTADRSSTGVAGVEFLGHRDGSPTLLRQVSTVTCIASSGSNFASAQIPLPTGVSLERVHFFVRDQDATHAATLFVHEVCQTFFGGGPVVTLLDSISTLGSSGWQQRTIDFDPAVTVGANFACTYIARIRFSNASSECVPTISVSQVSASWKRRISPAPDTATFDDVATGHPFFQHIEALADSGITSGCGGGNFCTGSPLTRGQMAVFLAKALGLHWPG